MVYASTRIKRTAAAAFEAETVETDDFIIQKPEGFLTVLNGDPQYAFESYSKEYGGEAAEGFRKGIAYLKFYDGTTVAKRVAAIAEPGDEIAGDITEVIGDYHYRVIEINRTLKDVEFLYFYKFAEKGGRVYEFQIIAIAETTDEFMRNIETMLAGFEIK